MGDREGGGGEKRGRVGGEGAGGKIDDPNQLSCRCNFAKPDKLNCATNIISNLFLCTSIKPFLYTSLARPKDIGFR